MRARHVRLLLVLSLGIAGVTLIQDVRFDLALARDRAARLSVEHDIAAIETSLAAWRAAQAGYVATGQGPSFWVKRAADRSADIEATIARLQAAATSDGAKAHYDQATAALGELNGFDGRARDFATSDRRFEASDLIFTEAVAPAQRLAEAVSAAREAEGQVIEARLIRTRWLRLGLNGLALGCLGLAVYLLERIARTADAAAEDAQTSFTAGPYEGVVSPARAAAVNLAEAAELCVDLGRVIDGREVAALFERVAPVLGAKGIVLWIADPGGDRLRPLLTLGYSNRVVERLGTLQTDSDNVTALAFRSMRSQAVNGSAPAAPGAIAVPLVTASGCIGVLSAEVSRTRPDHETLAVARMIAAQFAAIVAPATVTQLSEKLPEARTAQM
jgi:hypothetical protein